MQSGTLTNRRAALLLVSSSCSWLAANAPVLAQAKFTVAAGGPSGLLPATMYRTVGGVPIVAWPGSGLGCPSPLDDITSISPRKLVSEFVACSSVDPTSVGSTQGPPPQGLPPFSVFDQAQKRQVAGDLFFTSMAFSRSSGIIPGASLPVQQTYLAANQAAPWARYFGLLPSGGPEVTFPPLTPQDDIDGVINEPGVMPVYFTLTPSSPSLPSLVGANPSGADIVFDPQPLAPGTESVFAKAASLGLLVGDVIDAMIIYDDNADGVFNQVDTVIFSLGRNSPSLALLGATAADLLVVNSGSDATVQIFATANNWGLTAADNTDELDAAQLINQSAYQTLLGLIGDITSASKPNGPVATDLFKGIDLADASRVQFSMGLQSFGFSNAMGKGDRVADDVVVPAGEHWLITGFNFQSFQPGMPPGPSPLQAYMVGLWSEPPIVGKEPDLMPSTMFVPGRTNDLLSAFSGTFRVPESNLLQSSHPIFADACILQRPLPVVGPATIWIEWQALGHPSFPGPFVPAVTLANQTGKPRANATRFSPSAGDWKPIVDDGPMQAPQDLPFEVRFERVSLPMPCFADCDASGTLSIDDLICFQTDFALGGPNADCDANGELSIDDFICFLTSFALGC